MQSLAPLAAAVAARLSITEAAVMARLQPFVIQLAQHLAVEVEHAAAQLVKLGLDRMAPLLAHGPTEQVLAAIAPEAVADATLGGQSEAEKLPAGAETSSVEPEASASVSAPAKAAETGPAAETAESGPSKPPGSSAGA